MAGAVLALALTYATRRWAQGIKLVDIPNQRSMHRQVTPRGGGLAIVSVCLVGITVGAAIGLRPKWPAFAGYLAGVLLIVGVSLADDLQRVPSGLRLAVHVLGAALMVAGLWMGSELPAVQSGAAWLVLAAALLWTAGLTNAYNFMDGIDGLAATQGVVAGIGWTILASVSHQPWLALLALLVASGCAGFLVLNWPPASIFMGDVGSAFLGFTFAFIALATLRRTPQLAFIGALLLWPFIFDATLAVVRRLMRGENIFIAHRSHLYQRLVLAGWRQGSVTSLYGLFALVALGLGSLWLLAASATIGYFAIAVGVLLPLGLWVLVIRAERQASHQIRAL